MAPHGPAVFVHGNPESSAVWGPLLERLGRDDVICLSPPGFGAPLPATWVPSMASYRDWLIARLEAFRAPVDLVGHDWGGVHVLNAVMARPDLVRSWVSDAIGVFAKDYEWHTLAQIWQTPGDGERWIEDLVGASLPERIDRMHQRGLTDPVAARLAAAQDPVMGRAILDLYRAAVQPILADAGADIAAAAARPGLVVSASGDQMTGTEASRRAMAEAAAADLAVLDGLGHWWIVEDPARSAELLRDFWSHL